MNCNMLHFPESERRIKGPGNYYRKNMENPESPVKECLQQVARFSRSRLDDSMRTNYITVVDHLVAGNGGDNYPDTGDLMTQFRINAFRKENF